MEQKQDNISEQSERTSSIVTLSKIVTMHTSWSPWNKLSILFSVKDIEFLSLNAQKHVINFLESREKLWASKHHIHIIQVKYNVLALNMKIRHVTDWYTWYYIKGDIFNPKASAVPKEEKPKKNVLELINIFVQIWLLLNTNMHTQRNNLLFMKTSNTDCTRRRA